MTEQIAELLVKIDAPDMDEHEIIDKTEELRRQIETDTGKQAI